jgi:hypothetical protein
MFLISDITTFSKKKRSNRNNLLLGGAILGTGLLGVVGVKSYLRNGRLVKQYNRNQLLSKPVVKSTKVNRVNDIWDEVGDVTPVKKTSSINKDLKLKLLLGGKETKLLLPAATQPIIKRVRKRNLIQPINNDVIVLGDVNNKTNTIKDEFESYVNSDDFNYDELFNKFNLQELNNSEEVINPFITLRRKYIKDNNITEDERKSLVNYVRHNYEDVNNYLINGIGTNETKQLIDKLDNVLDRLPTFENRTMYRYIRNVDPNNLISNYKIGGIVTEPRFTSTSTNELFDETEFLKHSKVRFKIKSKLNNSNAVDIRGFNADEQEVIFKRGTSFKINNIKQHEFTYETRSNKNKPWKGYEIEIEEV